jgi:hypothetical protein
MFMRSFTTVLALGTILVGCASPVQLYEGPPKPDAEVAILASPGNATILQIDGKGVDRLEKLFALDPGPHVVLFRVRRTYRDFGADRATIEASSLTPQYTTHCFVTFEMQAGHRYAVVSAILDARRVEDPSAVDPIHRDHKTTVLAGIRDETTNTLVPDVRCDYREVETKQQ